MKNLLKLFITSSLFIFASGAMAENDCPLKFDANKYETSVTSYDEIELPINEFEYLKFEVNEWTNSINKKDVNHKEYKMHKGQMNHKDCKMNHKDCKMNQQQQKPNWVAPAKYKGMKGKGDANTGKELYNKHCKSCHGSKGLGDGPKAASLKTFPGDFSDKKFQSHTDGEIYFISIVGHNEMPNFEKKITDEGDRWSIVNYIRTCKK